MTRRDRRASAESAGHFETAGRIVGAVGSLGLLGGLALVVSGTTLPMLEGESLAITGGILVAFGLGWMRPSS